jgi:molybdopterin converting factor subunit 1
MSIPRRNTLPPLPRSVPELLLKIQYFALLREQAGRANETLETAAGTAADLYGELMQRYAFSLPLAQLKVAINGEFAELSQQLASGDSVVFIPPVAGG